VVGDTVIHGAALSGEDFAGSITNVLAFVPGSMSPMRTFTRTLVDNVFDTVIVSVIVWPGRPASSDTRGETETVPGDVAVGLGVGKVCARAARAPAVAAPTAMAAAAIAPAARSIADRGLPTLY
jgi:hypothetical protein